MARSPRDSAKASALRLPGPALLLACLIAVAAPAARAQAGDQTVVQAREALRTKDAVRLAEARQAVAATGHPLAMWVDYWELGNRLS
ncbi:MAG TPA: lytic transglycosylase domain-containing protein, partial [Rubrivivax sp.]|nr:lytic transglycosylase domain-containing protein [Rubrivivax sp.]